jgi:hypothetical protein
MTYFTCTIVGDGSSDRALVPIVKWALGSVTDAPFSVNYASYSELRTNDLELKVKRAVGLYPCDVLLVHRDAERPENFDDRLREINAASGGHECCIPIIPVRMTEAWLLFDHEAIRRAANNPNGRVKIELPLMRDIESLPDAKQTLFALLREASGLNGRRLRSFNEGRARARVAELIEDFSPLRDLPAFAAFETSIARMKNRGKFT